MTSNELQALIAEGTKLRDTLIAYINHLSAVPVESRSREDGGVNVFAHADLVDYILPSDPRHEYINDLEYVEYRASKEIALPLRNWLNKINHLFTTVLFAEEFRSHMTKTLQLVETGRRIGERRKFISRIEKDFSLLFDDLQTLPLSTDNTLPSVSVGPGRQSFISDTAFIMMWMDPTHPELEDVAGAFKEVCKQFGISAARADDIEHQDVITNVILDHIKSSEF